MMLVSASEILDDSRFIIAFFSMPFRPRIIVRADAMEDEVTI